MKSWHNAPLHECAKNPGQPIIPADVWDGRESPDEARWPARMHCLGCGEEWDEADPGIIAQAWWSHGAWCVARDAS